MPPLQAVGAAVRSGDLSFEFFDAPYWDRFGGLSDKTYADISQESGSRSRCAVSHPGVERLRHAIARRSRTGGQLASIELVGAHVDRGRGEPGRARAAGAGLGREYPPDRGCGFEFLARAGRGTAPGSGPQPIADADRGGRGVRRDGPAARPGAALHLPRSGRSARWMASVVEAVEATLEEAGLYERGTCTGDVFPRRERIHPVDEEERGDAAAVEDLPPSWASSSERSTSDRAGRPVKWFGDGVMVHLGAGQGGRVRPGDARRCADRGPAPCTSGSRPGR